MKVLFVGNSFSRDTIQHLGNIAKNVGISDFRFANLYIGGCPLEKHFRNALGDVKAYSFDFNGAVVPGLLVSIKEALLFDSWDFVTLQQASHFSARFETYEPYLSELAAYVRKYCPKAKLLIHQTWAYKDGSEKLAGTGLSYDRLQEGLKQTYARAAQNGTLVPVGDAFRLAKETCPQIELYAADCYHPSPAGSYLAACVFVALLCGVDPLTLSDIPMVAEGEHLRAIAKSCIRR